MALPEAELERRGKAATQPEPAVAFLPEAPREESLVVQTSFPGDVVLTTPLIAELAMRGPVDVVVTPAAAPVLANNPGIRHLYIYDKRGDQSGLRGLWRVSRELRGRRSVQPPGPSIMRRRAKRTAYLAQGSVRSAMLAVLAGCRERVGFTTASARALYTTCVLYRDDLHHAERLWRLAFASNASVQPPPGALRPRLFPSAVDVAAVDALLREHGIDAPFVALAPGSVWATKRWPYYAELARSLAPRVRLAIVGGPGDVDAGRAIADAVAPHAVVDATGKLTLLGSAELLRQAAALVTNDSAPQHLASAMSTPTLSVFGPTVPQFGFGPTAPRSATIGREALACRPCDHHGPQRCPLGHWRCMRELPASRVEAALLTLLS